MTIYESQTVAKTARGRAGSPARPGEPARPRAGIVLPRWLRRRRLLINPHIIDQKLRRQLGIINWPAPFAAQRQIDDQILWPTKRIPIRPIRIFHREGVIGAIVI